MGRHAGADVVGDGGVVALKPAVRSGEDGRGVQGPSTLGDVLTRRARAGELVAGCPRR